MILFAQDYKGFVFDLLLLNKLVNKVIWKIIGQCTLFNPDSLGQSLQTLITLSKLTTINKKALYDMHC